MLVLPNCPPDALAGGAPIPLRRSKFTLLALGYLSDRRGASLLMDAVQGLDDVSVIMAGKFDNPRIEERARSMPNVELTGWIPYERAVLLGCEGHLMYSFYDPAIEGNVLANSQKWFDAMMCGIPVLVNSEVANAPWIQREGFGVVCPYGDANLLRQAILKAKSEPAALEEMGRRGRRVFERDFDWGSRQLDLERAVNAALAARVPGQASLAVGARGD
jgi:glycosyltransferase involved in cell wall biosynthesis